MWFGVGSLIAILLASSKKSGRKSLGETSRIENRTLPMPTWKSGKRGKINMQSCYGKCFSVYQEPAAGHEQTSASSSSQRNRRAQQLGQRDMVAPGRILDRQCGRFCQRAVTMSLWISLKFLKGCL